MSTYAIKYPNVASYGHRVSHAKNRSSRTFKYNLKTVTVLDENGKKARLKVPAKVLKTLKKSGVTTHWKKPTTTD